jgi:carbamate kinase
MREGIVVALGGNALVKPGQSGTLEEQVANLRQSLAGVVELLRRGHRVVVTHGNGPQVGHILTRAEEARGKAYALPLDVCVAQSQGELGYLIQQTLHNLLQENAIDRQIAVVLTRTLVARDDPRLQTPTKPIGPFHTEAQAQALRARGLPVREDAHRGYRRVVASPQPLALIEVEVIRQLFEDDVVVIAAGGGGIPVCAGDDGTLRGIEAVVDKDLASSLLAVNLGATRILDLTAVERVQLNFGQPTETDLESLTAAEARQYLAEGHFAPGSMGPKIEAAIDFLEHGGREVIITRPEKAVEAFQGRTGTHVYPD